MGDFEMRTSWRGKRVPPEQRFWPRVERRGADECWPWRGDFDRAGYGRFTWDGMTRAASRYSLELHLGRPLGRLSALHSCDNPACVNPAHLRAGTLRDNTQDMIRKGRHAGQKKTHCKRGHPFDEKNTYLYSGNRRQCRACNAATQARLRGALNRPDGEGKSHD